MFIYWLILCTLWIFCIVGLFIGISVLIQCYRDDKQAREYQQLAEARKDKIQTFGFLK